VRQILNIEITANFGNERKR